MSQKEHPSLTGEEKQAAEKLQQLDWLHHIHMNNIMGFTLALKLDRAFLFRDAAANDSSQIFFSQIIASGLWRQMTHLQTKHGLRIGGETGDVRVPNVFHYNPEEHRAYMNELPNAPDPEGVLVFRSRVDIKKGKTWILAAEPVFEAAALDQIPPESTEQRLLR